MQDLPDVLTERVAFLLQLALARAQAMGERALTALGISGREYGVLAVLNAGSPSAQHHVGRALGVDRTSTVKLLAGLEARGLITRSPDPANRRAYLVTLTGTGELVRARAAAALADCDDRFLAPLAPGDRRQLRAGLQRLIDGPEPM